MTVQPAGTLNQKIDRRHVRDHDVEVQVEALLDNLGRDDYGPFGSIRAALAKPAQDPRLDLVTPVLREAHAATLVAMCRQ